MNKRFDYPYLDKDEFASIYDDLVFAVIIYKKYLNNDYSKNLLKNAFIKLVNYFNSAYNISVGVGFRDYSQNNNKAIAQLNLRNNLIEFNLKAINNIIIESSNKSKDYFNETSFSIYLINAVFHEYTHYLQVIKERGILTEDNYLLSLSILNDNYYERQIEGEAYGNGVNMIYYLMNRHYIKDSDIKQFNRDMQNNTFIRDSIGKYLLTHWLCIMPFALEDDSFNTIISIINNKLCLFDKDIFDKFCGDFPLALIGMDTYKKEKNAYNLIRQYLDKKIYFDKFCVGILNNEEIDELNAVYIYLLIPKLNELRYQRLCDEFGEFNMNNIMLKIKGKIEDKYSKYQEAYNESLYWMGTINQEKLIEMKVDREYIDNKYRSSIQYLNTCIDIINKCLKINQNNNRKI